ncbi:hypothetical protein [Arthrobacter sp. HY1533]|uniref:hypothetical protein n=1 Tax=Arthrobacter sp. HY1533 TaxID=2970919 RepID=UPI0022B9F820|nr:hypothetical protein [Arthrobacter sp. HY1533]
MSSKINIFPIVRDHFGTLRNAATGRLSPMDFIVHVGIPIAAGIASWWPLGFELTNAHANMVAALAIVFGFSFAVTVFVFQLRMQMAEMQISSEKRTVAAIAPQIDTRAPALVNQLFSNCLYAVVLSGFATLLTAVAGPLKFGQAADSILIAIILHLLMVLLMCFKRLNAAYFRVSSLVS